MANKSLSGAKFVKYGYGQVEDNHLSAPRNGQVYGQLPAASDITVLENGQFVIYDYAKGLCNLPGAEEAGNGPVMMVLNEVKIYRDRETDADFAMIKDSYNARVYSPLGQNDSTLKNVIDLTGEANREGDTSSPYVYQIGNYTYPAAMPKGTKMVPRVFKMSVGDIYTTNCVDEETPTVGMKLRANADGYLANSEGTGAKGAYGPTFQVVKVYTMPDMQPGVKLQCIAE